MAKIQSINEKYMVVDKVKGAVDRLVVYAIEIDSKYAIRTTAARLVVDGVNAVVGSKYITPMTLTASVASNVSDSAVITDVTSPVPVAATVAVVTENEPVSVTTGDN